MQQNEHQQHQKSFKYSIISQNPIPQRNRLEICMERNQQNSIFLFSEELTIRVFQFNGGMSLKQIQLLKNNRTSVLSFFPKQKDQFITCSEDSSILIWSKQLISKGKFIQKLSGHINGVSQQPQVSGGEDSQIKFWTPFKSNKEEQIRNISDQQWHCQQTIKDFKTTIATLSINEQGNKLISCSINQNILVIQKSSATQMWIVIQKIKIEIWVANYSLLMIRTLYLFHMMENNYIYIDLILQIITPGKLIFQFLWDSNITTQILFILKIEIYSFFREICFQAFFEQKAIKSIHLKKKKILKLRKNYKSISNLVS
ncbi:unnamed protein product [Paramecium pentaurelia]|uniref:Uncharacterized protein n=1 Tax=Paramecium pentaurelia TaxID=43138 RepID=A0A8S1U1F6_9CILI|nr:unnamed protein product [Paramecium pentaurelia]